MNRTGPAGVKAAHPTLPPGPGRRQRPPLRKLLTAVLAACLGVSLLTGCSPEPDLDDAAAGQLQSRVAAAKQLTAQRNFPAALAELEQLDQDVKAAAERGQMSQQRKTRIGDAIGTVKHDLKAAMAPTPQPATTTPATDPPEGNDGKKQEDDAEKEAKKEGEKREEEAKKEAEKEQEEAKKEEEEAKKEKEHDKKD